MFHQKYRCFLKRNNYTSIPIKNNFKPVTAFSFSQTVLLRYLVILKQQN